MKRIPILKVRAATLEEIEEFRLEGAGWTPLLCAYDANNGTAIFVLGRTNKFGALTYMTFLRR
jgi:hypothetical protein